MVNLPEGPAKPRQGPVSDDPHLMREEWLRLAAQGSQLGLWYWNEETGRVFWDSKACEMFGVSAEEEKTLETFYSCLHPEDRKRVAEVWRYQLERGIPYDVEYRTRRPDGSIRWVHALGKGYYDEHGKPLRMVGVVFDVTERLEANQERLKLAGRLIKAQEEERSRLARELHDDFAQRLALVSASTTRISEMVKDAAVRERVLEVLKTLREIGTDLQLLSHRLHSSKLEMLGLSTTVTSFCRDFSREHGIQIDVGCTDIPKSIPFEITLCLFRIVQEGLHNVVKHSRASRVEIRLNGGLDEICVTLRDNGVGFDLSKKVTSDGIGIQSMKERTLILDGTFQLQSAPMQGTQIEVKLPLKRRSTAA
jgi:PAS domain S-box-containing protein